LNLYGCDVFKSLPAWSRTQFRQVEIKTSQPSRFPICPLGLRRLEKCLIKIERGNIFVGISQLTANVIVTKNP
jgi:hypothetical protein